MHTQQPKRPLCRLCNTSLARQNGISKLGFIRWHSYCVECSNDAYNQKDGYLLKKGNVCTKCNFIPVDRCQLEKVYLDGNKKNKENSNVTTMCQNCSKLYKKNLKEKSKSKLDITTDADVDISSL